MEFGEKLRKAREKQGITQQTLADRLYVTRQAVSRWECGARYPDLLTAQKLAETLDTTLDELLSGEEQRATAEFAPVVETPAAGRIQSALYGFAGMACLLMALLSLRTLVQTPGWAGAVSFARYGGTVLLLGYGLALSVTGWLSPRRTGAVMGAYFVLEDAAAAAAAYPHAAVIALACHGGIDLVCLAVTVWYFFSRGRPSPWPVYGVAALFLLLTFATRWQAWGSIGGENELYFVISLLWLLAVAGLMALLSYQAHILRRKREKAAG